LTTKHDRLGKRQQQGLAAGGKRDLDQVAGAKVLDRDHGPEGRTRGVDRGEANEVRVIIFLGVRGLGKLGAGDEKFEVDQPFRRRPVAHAGKPSDEAVLRRAQRGDLEAVTGRAFQRAIGRDGERVGGE
jgi:hypothetical protein